ncbi:MAG: complex I subunit 1 family protein [Pseudomonadota bacterium]
MSIFLIALVRTVLVFSMVMCLISLLIWMERKGAAYIQDRRGPNRAQILGIRLGGIMHIFADAIKLLTKEEVSPNRSVKLIMYIAPMIAFFVSVAAVAVVPFSDTFSVYGYEVSFQVAELRAGLVYVLAMTSLGVYSLMLAGWASGSTYSLLGGMRACAQFISYELAMAISAVALFLVAGSLSLSDIVMDQGTIIWQWNAVRQPLAFVIFMTALFAQTSRLPFDLPDGESEIIGYHVEYSSMRFALFFMGEYAHIIVGSAIVAALFFGGWQVPFAATDVLQLHATEIGMIGWPILSFAVALMGMVFLGRMKRRFCDIRDYEPIVIGTILLFIGIAVSVLYALHGQLIMEAAWFKDVLLFLIQLVSMLMKTIILCAVFIWVRWTLPRFRYDQLMSLGWKVLLPLAMANVVVTAIGVMLSS